MTRAAIRVLIVEDSSTVRARLREALGTDADLEVVGEAADGRTAIELCLKLRPDVITLDMMLPVMSGLAATEYIMAFCPTPILIVSASTNRGELFKTYDALAAGALDVLEKPGLTEAEGDWDQRLRSTVKLVSRVRVITHPRARLATSGRWPEEAVGAGSSAPARAFELVAIGASTGGPGAIVELLRAIPAPFPLPVLLVLHIGEPFAGALADWLDAQTAHAVGYAPDGQTLREARGRVLLAPPSRHLAVRSGRLQLNKEAERHSCRPSVDVLFESLARECGSSTAACLLTGMGRDGAAGLLAIRQAGGLTLAQDESTSVVYGMPREAVLLGAAERVLPLPEIGPALALLATRAGPPGTP